MIGRQEPERDAAIPLQDLGGVRVENADLLRELPTLRPVLKVYVRGLVLTTGLQNLMQHIAGQVRDMSEDAELNQRGNSGGAQHSRQLPRAEDAVAV